MKGRVAAGNEKKLKDEETSLKKKRAKHEKGKGVGEREKKAKKLLERGVQ